MYLFWVEKTKNNSIIHLQTKASLQLQRQLEDCKAF